MTEQLAQIAEEAKRLDEEEATHVGRFADLMEQMMVVYGDACRFWQRRQSVEFLGGQFVGEASVGAAMEIGRCPWVVPQPMSFASMFELVYAASCDPAESGYREGRPLNMGTSALENWREATRDLRGLDIIAPVPLAARPRYSSAQNARALHGEGRTVQVDWKHDLGRREWG